jgi:hypothetical protein
MYGGNPQHVSGLSADLRAVRPETEEVVASATIHPNKNLDSDQELTIWGAVTFVIHQAR